MVFYLFPGAMYHRVKRIAAEQSWIHSIHNDVLTLENPYELYNLCTKQYLGFGSLLQFVPGTNANRARNQLSNDLEPHIQRLKDHIAKKSIIKEVEGVGEFRWFKNQADRLSLYSYFNVSAFFNLLEDMRLGFNYRGIAKNQKLSLRAMVVTFPILNDAFFVDYYWGEFFQKKNPVKNILHSILNPVRLVDGLLNFLHQAAYRLLDIGSNDYASSSWPRFLLKGMVGLFFGIIRLPVKILQHAIDLPLNIVKSIIIDPIGHIGSSIYEAYQNSNKKVLIATAKELKAVKELRRIAKERPDTSYSAITKQTSYKREYIGLPKEQLYKKELYQDSEVKPERLVAIRAVSEKMILPVSLLSLITIFKGKPEMTPEMGAELINQAKEVVNKTRGL